MQATAVSVIGWIALAAGAFAVVAYFWLVLREHFSLWRLKRTRRRADEGKVKCQSDKCKRIATSVTPHGYFCDEHWGENHRQFTNHGYVSWMHPLNHVLKGRHE
jgi:uncharacterized membrane protein YcjF (UPF0283 family)